MKQKIYSCFALLLCLPFLLFGCSENRNEGQITETASNTTLMERELIFAKLPSPPQSKTITNPQAIDEILKFIEESPKEKTESSEENGWYIMISVTQPEESKKISVLGNTLTVDGVCYKVNDDFVKGLEELYDKADVKEEAYIG